MKVFISHYTPDDIVERIAVRHDVTGQFRHEPLAYDRLVQAVKDQDGLLCNISDVIDQAVLASGTHLKIVANFGVGFNNIDVDEATRRGIIVTNTPDVLTDATADLAMALVLAVGRPAGGGVTA